MATEVTKNIDALVAKLTAAEGQFQKLIGLAERLGGVQYNAPGVGTGAPVYATAGGVPGNTTGGVTASVTPTGAAAPTPASQAAQQQVRLSGAQQAVANQLYSAGLNTAEMRQAWGQVGLPGAPQPPPGPSVSPNAVAVSLIQSAQAGASFERTMVFGPTGPQMGGGMAYGRGAYMAGGGENNLYAPPGGWGPDPNRTIAFDPTAAWAAQAQASKQRSYVRSRALEYGGAALLYGAGTGLDISAQMAASGRVSPMSIGSGVGSTVGALAGGVAGALLSPVLGPYAPMVGMAAGGAMGGGIGGWITAPFDRAYNVNASFMPGAGLLGPTGGTAFTLGSWAEAQARSINAMAGSMRQNVTPQSLGAGFSTMAAALIGSGMDPTQTIPGTGMSIPGTPGTPGRWVNDWSNPIGGRNRASAITDPSRLFNASAGAAIDAINQLPTRRWSPGSPGSAAIGYPDETLPRAISRRVHEQYPNDEAAQSVIKQIAPIWHTLPATGGSTADIISRFGAAGFIQFRQSQRDTRRDPLGSALAQDIDREMASRFESSLQSTQRGIEMGGLQIRGSGLATATAYLARMEAVSAVPGGGDSLAFLQARSGYLGAARTAFDQSTSTQYSVPMSNIEAARGIAASSPFAPGNRFAIELSAMRLNQQQIGRLQTFREGRRAGGLLSEDEELDLTQQINALRVSNARSVGMLSEGVENRMPALFANRTPGFSRWDSTQMAALQFARIGSPVRAFGAMGGGQARMQDDFAQSFGMGSMNPRNPMDPLNPAGGEITRLLGRILEELQRGRLGGGRRSGGGGMPPDGGMTPMGADAPFN